MITIKDIAREAGVSATTVSRVINNIPNKVSQEKREQIQSLIEKYDFMPNPSARSLTAKESNIIAILIRPKSFQLQPAFLTEMLQALVSRIQEHAYLPTIYYIDTESNLDKLKKFNIDGAVLLGDFDDLAECFIHREYPVVFIDSYAGMRLCSHVGVDDYKAGMLAAQYLLEKQCTEFLYLESDAISQTQQTRRLDGYQSSITRHNPSLTAKSVTLPQLKSLHMSQTNHTGLFVQTLQDAYHSSTLLRNPDHLICFDYVTSCAAINFAVISQDIDQKAKAVTDILWKQIQNSDKVVQHLIFDVRLGC